MLLDVAAKSVYGTHTPHARAREHTHKPSLG